MFSVCFFCFVFCFGFREMQNQDKLAENTEKAQSKSGFSPVNPGSRTPAAFSHLGCPV